MSMYNMLFGEHSNAADLLRILGITEGDVPRYRSCYWNGTHIVIHTRTGGGNRDFYENEESCRSNYPEYFDVVDANPPTGPWNDDLRAIPGYVEDMDDDFDCTYADFLFNPPAEVAEALKQLPADISPSDQWNALWAALEKKNTTNGGW